MYLVIKGGGNVGIGTTSPASLLDVQSTITAESGLVLGASATTSVPNLHADGTNLYLEANSGHFYLRPLGSGNNTNAAVLTNQGYLGILTLTPGYPVDVAGTIRCTGILLGGDMLMYDAIKDSTGQYTRLGSGGCFYAS
ncbi:MAG: hypothetical protein M1118_14810 [Chloroflexi bacterium]|nr:hypothetical protein [Chloroflexota bacterium]